LSKLTRRRWWIWGAIGIAFVALIAVALAPRPVRVDVESTARGALEVTLDHEGRTRVRERYEISAPVPGRVLRIRLEPGDPVVANETVLAIFEPIDASPLDKRSRAEAEAKVQGATAVLARARADRERARAEMEYAESELERNRRLAAQGIVSQERLDLAGIEARVSHEALDAAAAATRAASYDLEAARARLLEPGEGETQSGSIHLRSPIDGVVLRRLRQSAAVVAAGEPLLEVADPADLEVVADFLSNDAVKMESGMRVLIDEWGGDEVLRASVRRVEPSGFMKVSALGVEEQRVNVVVDFDDPREAWEKLGDEYRVEVRVVVWQSDDVLLVPTGALFRHAGGWAVFHVAGKRARLQPVEVGQRNGLHAQVLSGLDAGATVVIHPSDSVEDGVRVALR
jgi:HlyD family secretion protein